MTKALSAFEQGIVNNVDEHGWQGNHVFDPDGDVPAFTYTIGFPQTLNCPDFIIFGLPQKLMHNMLWDIFKEIRDGRMPQDHQEWPGLLEGDYMCVTRAVHPANLKSNYFNSALWHHRHIGRDDQEFGFFQLFWPGTKIKRLPWQHGCHEDVIVAQPLLYDPGHEY